MARQLFQVGAGLQIADAGAIISGTGLPGSGTNDATAQTVDIGTIYIRIGVGTAEFYQKITAGATTGDWDKLILDAEVVDLTALRTLTGTTTGDTDLGTFTGSLLTDNITVKAALQEIETAVEGNDTDISDLITLSGVSANSTNLGTFTGDVITDSVTVKTALQELETYAEQTRSLVSNFEWQESVIDKDLTAPPGSPSTGDRYLLGTDTTASVVTGAWAGQDGNIAEWNGSSWEFTTPTVGTYVAADDESSVLYLFGGTTWSAQAFENTTASTGLTKVGVDIQLASSSAGDGLAFTAGVLSVNVDDVTIELVTDTLQVKADGINDTHIDFGTGTNQVSGEDIPLADAGNYFTTDNVEAALQELGAAISTQANNLGVIAGATTVADSILVDEVASVIWHVYVQETATGDTESFQVQANHDGIGATDASNANFTDYGNVKSGGTVNGLTVDVVLTGTGVTQEMELQVSANNAYDIRVKKISTIEL